MKRLIVGGLIVLIAAAVGGASGYMLAYALILASYHSAFGSQLMWWVLYHYHAVYLPAFMIVGAVGGIFLGAWLNRRIFGRIGPPS